MSTDSKTLSFDGTGQVVARALEPLKTHYADNGYVEQEPVGIYCNLLTSVGKCLSEYAPSGGSLHDITVGGISNQRETFGIWNAVGEPHYKAVVWPCKRSIAICPV